MTLGGVRGFLRTTLNALKLKEWTDGFSTDNIPATIIDGSYHLDVGHIRIKTAGVNANALDVMYPITLKVFAKGFKNPALAIDAALDRAQNILSAFVSANKTLNQQGLKRVIPTGLDTQPLRVDNTHCVMLVMTFDASLVLGF